MPPSAPTSEDRLDTTAPLIVVVGSANADFHLSLDQLPAPGETVLARETRWLPGGKGANQAAAAARLGAHVMLIAAVGDDPTADVALAGLAADGVAVDSVRRVPGTPSGVAVVCVDSEGENQIVVAPGANQTLSPADVALLPICGAVLVSLEIPPVTAAAALARSRVAGALTVLNAAPATDVRRDLLKGADVLVANEGEAAALAGTHGHADLAALAADTATTVVATSGAGGVWAVTPTGERHHVPALPAEVVDTVGAGDCFAAALTVALVEGRMLRDALAFATAAASIKVGRRGARGLPTRAEVEALVSR
jgi:ribokinase